MSIRTIPLMLLSVFLFGLELNAQQPPSFCCTVIDIRKDSGTVIIRNHQERWISSFKPSALEFAEVAIGDSVGASIVLRQVNKLKGRATVYPLLQPYFGLPCCEVLRVDGEGILRTITATTSGGDSIKFEAPDTLTSKMKPGSKIYTSAGHGFAMVLEAAAKDSSLMLYYGFPLLAKESE